MGKKIAKRKPTAIIVRPASFPEPTRNLIQVATPTEFIKNRPGKGGKQFTYVEGGYVIAQLNKIFKNCWDFVILSERVEPNEVVIRGALKIKDFKTGHSIVKTQYGTKERNAGVPLGDTLKAAATDCLKKCASMLGIALDVYWKQEYLEEMKEASKLPAGVRKGMPKNEGKVAPEAPQTPPKKNTMTKAQAIELMVQKIKTETDQTILSQYFERVQTNPNFTVQEKQVLIKTIADQRKKNVNNNGQGNLL